MNPRLKHICRQALPQIIHDIKHLEPHHQGLLFDRAQYRIYGESKHSYVGTNLCGEACLSLLSQLTSKIEMKNHSIHVIHNQQGNGRHQNDHCFLWLDHKWIIDPTYRQFLKEVIEPEPESLRHLFETLPPIFVGDISDLDRLLGHPLFLEKNLERYWRMQSDVTDRFQEGLKKI